MTFGHCRTSLCPLLGEHGPAEPYLGTPGVQTAELCGASHEAAARAGHSGEAAQLLGLSIASGSLPPGIPNSLHASPALGSAQVSSALSLGLLSWRMGRQVWHSTVRSPFICIRLAALINLP